MNNRLTVLMYHALLGGDGQCAGADPRYAVTRKVFRQQLAEIKRQDAKPQSLASILASSLTASDSSRDVVFTFDDGHASNADAAADLAEAGGSGDFFVNSSTVCQPNNLNWATLREMAGAGASIQSHGHTHRYFNELSESEIRYELLTSKHEIEARIGLPVTIFAPPGGRLQPAVARIAREVGYVAICSSNVGLWGRNSATWNIPRFAVLRETGDGQFRQWVSQDRLALMHLTARQTALDAAKKIFGNRGYEKLRARLLGGDKGGGGGHDDSKKSASP